MENKIHSVLVKQFVSEGFLKTNSLDDRITEKELLNIYQEWSKTLINKTTFHKLLEDNHQVSFTTKKYYVCLKLDIEKLNAINTQETRQDIPNTTYKANCRDSLISFIKEISSESAEPTINKFSSELYKEFLTYSTNEPITQTKFGLEIVKIDGLTKRKIQRGVLITIDTARFK